MKTTCRFLTVPAFLAEPFRAQAQFTDHFMPIARTICRKAMATRYRAAQAFGLLAILLPASPLTVEGCFDPQFIYTIDNGAITIIGCGSAGIGEVAIPSTLNGLPVTAIGESAFASDSSLNSVTIPDSITNMGKYAFWNCSSLTSINVDIGNPAYSSVAGVLFNKSQTTLIQYPTGAGRYGVSYTIPDTVTTIGDRAFMDCGLTNITIPDSVTSIGNSVFNACQNLRRITIPDSVTNLGNNGFAWCGSLTSVTIGNGVPGIEDGLCWNCSSLGNLTIGNRVTNIAAAAFSGCTGLTSVTIPDSVSSIGAEAFSNCSMLTSVSFLGNAPSADATVFDGDNALVFYPPGTTGWGSTLGGALTVQVGSLVGPFFCATNHGTITIVAWSGGAGPVTIPGTLNGWPVTSIGENGFASMRGEANVTVPASVTNIGETAFSTRSLESITVDLNNPAYSSVAGVLFDKRRTTLIQYPSERGGSSYSIPPTVTTIDDQAFMNCGLASIAIPDSVTSIGNSVFNNCGNLSRITIPDSVTNLGSKGFFSCQNLISVTIGNGVPSIEPALFQNCRSLRNLTIGSSVTNIAGSAFSGCTGLTNVTIPASVNSIGAEAFSDCTSLKSVYFLGDAPSADATVFDGDNMIIDYGIVYYLPGMTGWGSTFGGAPTAEWLLPHPLILNNEPSAAAQSNNFAFTISWATNTAVVVEVCTNLANPLWLPVATNILTNGSSYFSEPLQTNSAGRFYRIAVP